jgi:hypothetical protein
MVTDTSDASVFESFIGLCWDVILIFFSIDDVIKVDKSGNFLECLGV